MTAASDRYPGGRHRRLDAEPDIPAPADADAQPAPRPARRRFRPKSIRARVVALLAVPVVAVMALWGLVTVTEVRAAYTAQQIKALNGSVQQPMAAVAAALGQERASAVRYLSQPSSSSPGLPPASADAAVATARDGAASAAVALDALSPALRARVDAVLGDFDTLPQLQQRVATRGVSAVDAYAAYTNAIEDARAVGTEIDAIRAASDASTGTRLGSLLGLPVIILSLLVSVRIGRGLVLELVGLRDTALELAGRRLPDAMARLRSGGTVDLDAVAPLPAPDPAPEDEVGQVAEALAVVQRAALEAATERAEVVSGVARVFLNLARRSQLLVHQQLTLLDAMERRVDDPEEVEDLYRLDHLATRMRRHAEGLIILSGSPPGRGWRRPVPLVDVLRSAAAEVEDFGRVDVRPTADTRVVGGAVADLTHLVAELIENATAFSPPYTRVTVRAAQDGPVCVVEVEDRGLGMGEEALADANRRIADARPGDLFDSEQLGLFVVSRLARRHQVQVRLQRTAAGGTTAIVALPASVLALAEDGLAESGAGDAGVAGAGAAAVAAASATVLTPGGHAGRESGQRANGHQRALAAPVLDEVGSPGGMGSPGGIGGPGGSGSPGEMGGPGGMSGIGDRAAVPRRAATSPRPATAAPMAPHPDGTPLRPPASEVAPEATAAGLPRRVRQANMAPQLRGRNASRAADHAAPELDDDSSAPRDPETVRATMAAFQSGWTRGRHGDLDRHGDSERHGDPERHGDSEQRGTPERHGDPVRKEPSP